MDTPRDTSRPFPLSNSRKFVHSVDTLGLDRLSFTFAIRDFDSNVQSWNSVTISPRNGEEIRRYSGLIDGQISGSKIHLSVVENPFRGVVLGRVEFNPSRHIDPEGWRLVGVQEGLSVVPGVWECAGELVKPATALEDAHLTRLDLAKDFEFGSGLSRHLDAMSRVSRTFASRNATYHDNQNNGAQTFICANTVGAVRMYDKNGENDEAPEGTLRVEVQARSKWLERYGQLRSVSEANDPQLLAGLAQNRTKWAKVGLSVVSELKAAEVVAQSDIPSRSKGQFLIWLFTGQSLGSRTTAAKYRKWQEQLGVAVSGDTLTEEVVRVDFESGRVLRGGVEVVRSLSAVRSVA